jgi:hypothetical protein
MMDAKARLDCMKEINLLQVGLLLPEWHLLPTVTNFVRETIITMLGHT